jgi:hypothetical protein
MYPCSPIARVNTSSGPPNFGQIADLGDFSRLLRHGGKRHGK